MPSNIVLQPTVKKLKKTVNKPGTRTKKPGTDHNCLSGVSTKTGDEPQLFFPPFGTVRRKV